MTSQVLPMHWGCGTVSTGHWALCGSCRLVVVSVHWWLDLIGSFWVCSFWVTFPRLSTACKILTPLWACKTQLCLLWWFHWR